MARKFSFNPGCIDNLRQGKIDAPETPGLSIVVRENGRKKWRYRRRIRGSARVVELLLGPFPAYSMAMERTYDLYELEDEKRAWSLKWENEVISIARRAGVADALEVPAAAVPPTTIAPAQLFWSPQSARIQPRLHFGKLEPRAAPVLAEPASELVLGGEVADPALAKPIDLASG